MKNNVFDFTLWSTIIFLIVTVYAVNKWGPDAHANHNHGDVTHVHADYPPATNNVPLTVAVEDPPLPPPETATYDFQELLDAIREVETGGEPDNGIGAIGDGGNAIGPFQIWDVYHTDAIEQGNKEGIKWRIVIGKQPDYDHCLDDYHYSEMVVWLYARRYNSKAMEHEGKLTLDECEDIARDHNGGPSGDTKPATLPYWEKVKKILTQ